jgi:NhaP-type Na+/H+ or K+/H+ antiporter
MGKADARFSIRHEYQALYGIGLVLGAFATGQVVQGDGFLTAFFAGLAVTLFNVSLCDCFLEYGEVTSEIAMLLAFVLFGAVLSRLLSTVALLPALALALIAISLVRPIAMGSVLQGARMSHTARAFIGWFGPRGLNSLLLALLVVQAHVPAAEALLAVTGVVVLVSVATHGISATPLSNWYGRRVAQASVTLAEEREGTAVGLFQADPTAVPRITPQALAEQLASPNPPIVLDVRARAQYDQDEHQIPGSVRVLPDQVEAWANTEPPQRAVVAYCT